MKNKIVSFKVAKAIKKAGYPQNIGKHSWFYIEDTGECYYISCQDFRLPHDKYVNAPTYFDIWFWLWREHYKCYKIGNDPEEAIIAAIEYLVNNDLIK